MIMEIEAIINKLGTMDLLMVYGGTVLVLVLAIIVLAVRKKTVAKTEQVTVTEGKVTESEIDSQTEELESQIQDLQGQIASLENALVVAEAKVAGVSGEPEAVTKKLIEENRILAKEKQKLESQLQTSEAEKKSISDKLQSEFRSWKNSADVERQKLAEQLKTVESEKKSMDNLQSEIQSLKGVVASAEAEKKKLQEKLEEAEEEIEDLEDEIDKKSKKHKEEISQKDKAITDLQYVKSKLDTEIQNKDRKIKEQCTELSVKGDSLGFVREILKAKDVSNKAKFYQKVDSLVEYIEDEIQEVVKAARDFGVSVDEDLFSTDLIHWKQIVKKDWLKNKRAVAFVGEFSAGKTSIVNKILESSSGAKVELPTSTKATTAIPTYISENSQSKGATFQFFTPDNRLKGLTEDSFKKVSKEILDQVDGVSALIKYFIMTCNNPQLKNLSILDTPGFNSNDTEDTERTIGVINECDALFWIFDVNAGEVNKSSLDIIKKNLRKPLYVVINKTDTKAKGEVEKVESHIKITFQNAGITVQDYIWYSKKEPSEKIMNALQTISMTNTTDDYLERLMSLVQGVQGLYEDYYDQQAKKQRRAEEKADELYEDFCSLVDEIGDSCSRASRIPQFKERIFRGDIFQMDADEGHRLISLLDDVSGNLVEAAQGKFDEYGQARAELKNMETESSEWKARKKQLETCANDLKKRIEGLRGGR